MGQENWASKGGYDLQRGSESGGQSLFLRKPSV